MNNTQLSPRQGMRANYGTLSRDGKDGRHCEFDSSEKKTDVNNGSVLLAPWTCDIASVRMLIIKRQP